uniref:hypothetical protein n=1 Tax=Limnohabitans sp. TaxID=1907725 RepID=UPI0040487E01
MNLGCLLILPFVSINAVLAAEIEVGADYSRAPDGLVIKGRTIPVKFGAAVVGFKTQLSPESTFAIRVGKGYDPNVSRTFLDVDSNGPATCDIFAVEVDHRLTSVGPLDISGGGGFKYQRVHAKLSGNRDGGPFTGTAENIFRSVDVHLIANYPLSDTSALYGQVGLQSWRYNFEAFGSMERVRVWTDSSERGVSPKFAVGGSRKFGDFKMTAELSTYSLRSDNKTWVSGLLVKASRAW